MEEGEGKMEDTEFARRREEEGGHRVRKKGRGRSRTHSLEEGKGKREEREFGRGRTESLEEGEGKREDIQFGRGIGEEGG